MKISRFRFWLVLAVSICALAAITCLSGCEMFANHTNPVAGWQIDFKHEPNQAVIKDATDYINKLPSNQRNRTGPQQWLTDGKGQHALVIPVALNGTDWGHVLIYDKNDKRIKVIKYVMGNYAC
jgi:hypothetical protein